MKCMDKRSRSCCASNAGGECLSLTNTKFPARDGRCPFYCSYDDKKEIYTKNGWMFGDYAAIESDKRKKERNREE